jgi:hypothetical protein
MAKRKSTRRQPQQYPWEQIEGATGASDANSGAGSGSGVPSGDLAMRVGDEVTRGNVSRDRRKLFPERYGPRPGTAQTKAKPKASAKPAKKARRPAKATKPAARKRSK